MGGFTIIISEIEKPFRLEPSTFNNNPKLPTLYVPVGKINLYKATEGWNEFANIDEIQNLAVTLTANSYNKVYGDDNPAFEYTVTEGAIASGSPSFSCEATNTSPAGTYNIIIEKCSVSNNTVNLVNGTLTITKAPLTVSIKDVVREQGEENPQFEIIYEGWKLQDSESVLLKKPVATTTATKDSPSGEYVITVGGGEALNYELRYESGKLTVMVPNGIHEVTESDTFDIYDTTGRKVRRQTTTLESLPKGIYIVGGRKRVVK